MKISPITTTTTTSGRMLSVEWNHHVSVVVQHRLLPSSATHFVLPDLPGIVSDREQAGFMSHTRNDPSRRIHTIATCHHETHGSLLERVSAIRPSSNLLLVSGNNHHKGSSSLLSSIDAAKILRNEVQHNLYGVADPNDPLSVEAFDEKLDAGMTGFITQPLLSSCAVDTMQAYREQAAAAAAATNNNDDAKTTTTILAGMAFPKSVKGLRFWAKLLNQEEALEKDDRFRSHLAYFSQPTASSAAWVEGELRDLLAPNRKTDGDEDDDDDDCPPLVDGFHFMPLQNTDDLCRVVRSLDDPANPQ